MIVEKDLKTVPTERWNGASVNTKKRTCLGFEICFCLPFSPLENNRRSRHERIWYFWQMEKYMQGLGVKINTNTQETESNI